MRVKLVRDIEDWAHLIAQEVNVCVISRITVIIDGISYILADQCRRAPPVDDRGRNTALCRHWTS